MNELLSPDFPIAHNNLSSAISAENLFKTSERQLFVNGSVAREIAKRYSICNQLVEDLYATALKRLWADNTVTIDIVMESLTAALERRVIGQLPVPASPAEVDWILACLRLRLADDLPELVISAVLKLRPEQF